FRYTIHISLNLDNLSYTHSCIFFFFQAEDGIRDRNVTGVQTCALPILQCAPTPTLPNLPQGRLTWPPAHPTMYSVLCCQTPPIKIGRASCREIVSKYIVVEVSRN